MHVKDSGTILLTQDDYNQFLLGQVSERVKGLWGLTYEQLAQEVQNKNYKVIDGTEITRTEGHSTETSSGSSEECGFSSGANGAKD